MKRTLTLLAVIVLLPAYTLARDLTTRLAVEDMHCPACPPAVTKALKQVAGVKSVTISASDRTATVVADDSVTTSTLVDAIAKAGFSATVAKEN